MVLVNPNMSFDHQINCFGGLRNPVIRGDQRSQERGPIVSFRCRLCLSLPSSLTCPAVTSLHLQMRCSVTDTPPNPRHRSAVRDKRGLFSGLYQNLLRTGSNSDLKKNVLKPSSLLNSIILFFLPVSGHKYVCM